MRLGFSGWAMRELPVDQQIAIVREAGYASICLVSGPTFGARRADRRRGRAATHPPPARRVPGWSCRRSRVMRRCSTRTGEARANAERIKATIDLAADLAGRKGRRASSPWAYGTPETYEQDASARRAFRRAGEHAEHARRRGGAGAARRAGVRPAGEGRLADGGGRLAALPAEPGQHPLRVMGRDLDDYLPLLSRTRCTPTKDQRGRYPNHEFLVPGEGDFDYARYLKAMERRATPAASPSRSASWSSGAPATTRPRSRGARSRCWWPPSRRQASR